MRIKGVGAINGLMQLALLPFAPPQVQKTSILDQNHSRGFLVDLTVRLFQILQRSQLTSHSKRATILMEIATSSSDREEYTDSTKITALKFPTYFFLWFSLIPNHFKPKIYCFSF